MGIRFHCLACGNRLNVKSFLAGKRGICPRCGAGLDIPLESQIEGGKKSRRQTATRAHAASASAPSLGAITELADSEEDVAFGPGGMPEFPDSPVPDDTLTPSLTARAPAASASPVNRVSANKSPGKAAAPALSTQVGVADTRSETDSIDEAPTAVWYVRPPSGGQYGPARGDVMRRWISEGRVSADSLVWREGWKDWRSAGQVFPSLLAAKKLETTPVASPVAKAAVAAHAPSEQAKSPGYVGAVANGARPVNGAVSANAASSTPATSNPLTMTNAASQATPGGAKLPASAPRHKAIQQRSNLLPMIVVGLLGLISMVLVILLVVVLKGS